MLENTIMATEFVRPNGKRVQIEVTDISPEDAAYINANNIKVSMEELMTGGIVVYFDDGKFINDDPEEDPDEIVVISHEGNKSCEECMREGVEFIKRRNRGIK